MALVYCLYYAALPGRYDTLWLYGILFVFFYLAFMLWQTYYAIATCRTAPGARGRRPPAWALGGGGEDGAVRGAGRSSEPPALGQAFGLGQMLKRIAVRLVLVASVAPVILLGPTLVRAPLKLVRELAVRRPIGHVHHARTPGRVRGLRVLHSTPAAVRIVWRRARHGHFPIEGYRVWRDGEVVGQTPGLSYALRVGAASVHVLGVAAVDVRGHVEHAARSLSACTCRPAAPPLRTRHPPRRLRTPSRPPRTRPRRGRPENRGRPERRGHPPCTLPPRPRRNWRPKA